jgi:hypothetical protein
MFLPADKMQGQGKCPAFFVFRISFLSFQVKTKRDSLAFSPRPADGPFFFSFFDCFFLFFLKKFDHPNSVKPNQFSL